jgi:hypothetical protein
LVLLNLQHAPIWLVWTSTNTRAAWTDGGPRRDIGLVFQMIVNKALLAIL